MTTRSVVGASSPVGLRLLHAAVFLAMAAGVLYVSVPEWRHVLLVLGQPFHAGPLPRWLLLAGSLVAAVGVLPLAWGLVRGRSAPLWASGAVLVSLVGAVGAGDGRPLAEARSEESANLAILRVGRRVHLSMVQELQAHGGAPIDVESWRKALEVAGPAPDRIRTRELRAVAPHVVWLESDEDSAEPMVPGSLRVHVTPDGVAFSIRLVGLRDGKPVLLLDDRGKELVLRGLFNPDLPPAEKPAVSPIP
ncbi:hypothetical protein [Myxococcus landrumensis]|uniref:Uncharacterized protein n=1 Tax=Myxococcus landrumensis TaxID=2813577 RepID=A0ABX7NEK3_9BACT|nr:hypothetical protein [Myxococcus landrumus]QSQ14723.1 hypothetical protein JY572_01105 [Myxococcus landrumus]